MKTHFASASSSDSDLFFADLMGMARPRQSGAARRAKDVAPVRAGGVVGALQSVRLRMERVEARARQVGGARATRLLDREQRWLERALNELVEREPIEDTDVLGQVAALAAPRRTIATVRSPLPRDEEDSLAEALPSPIRISLPIPTAASGASAFWGSVVATNARESAAGRIAVYEDGDLRYVAQTPPEMRVIRRTAEELFSTTVTREVAARNLRVAINGNMFDVSTSGKADIFVGHDPVPAGETSPIGRVIVGGTPVAGSSQPDRFHLSFNSAWAPVPLRSSVAYRFGPGDPPVGTGGAQVALGGLGPIIIDGLRFGAGNLYRTGVPAGAPVTGPVSAVHLPFLIQKNNNHYVAFQGRGASVGKVVVAINRTQDLLLVLVQSQGGSSGMTLDTLRDKLIAVGCSDAVFGDGSDSVMLVAGGTTLIAQGEDKEEATTIGLGFV